MSHEEAPARHRRHRRVVAPATNAAPEDSPDFSEPHLEAAVTDDAPTDSAQQIGTDEWWRAQRPPHWG